MSAATRQAREVDPRTPMSLARPAWSASRCQTWWASSAPTSGAVRCASASHVGLTYSRQAGSVAIVATSSVGTATRAYRAVDR